MIKKTSMTALMFATTLSGFVGITQQTLANETTHFQSSRQAIAGACSNGVLFGTDASSGDYGCVDDDHSIYCTENGDCVMDVETADRRLPPSRGQSDESGGGNNASHTPSRGETGGTPSGGNSGGTFGGTFSTQAPTTNQPGQSPVVN